MKRMTLLLVVLVAALLTLVGSGPAAAQQKPFVLNMAWQPENETFAAWYASQKGWDKEEGLEFKLHYFDSGMAQLEALPAKQWVFAGMGGVPATVGALRFGTYLFALGNDESVTNAVMVRANSPIMQAKGFNPKFPEVFGKPDLLKGKTFLVTTVSSGHFAMSKYLEVFGLKDSDVVVKNMATNETYTTTKGALTLLTKSIAVRYAKDNIRCNSIHPSTVDTPLLQTVLKDPVRRAERYGEVPLGRLATSLDVANAFVYLASDEASFVNGVAFPVDGGTTAW